MSTPDPGGDPHRQQRSVPPEDYPNEPHQARTLIGMTVTAVVDQIRQSLRRLLRPSSPRHDAGHPRPKESRASTDVASPSHHRPSSPKEGPPR